MKKMKFKTNINCNGCIATVTPYLEKVKSVNNWEVDITNKNKILTVKGENLNKEEIENAVKEAGFTIDEKKPGFFG